MPIHSQLPNYYLVPDLSTGSDRVCALINIYEVSVLVDGLGGLENAAAAVAAFRSAAKARGMPCIHLQVSTRALKLGPMQRGRHNHALPSSLCFAVRRRALP